MKQIIVAIDFSRCSLHALEYAINLANRIKSNILMVWVDNTKSDESVYPEVVGGSRKEITNSFDEIIAKYGPTLKRVRLPTRSEKGKCTSK